MMRPSLVITLITLEVFIMDRKLPKYCRQPSSNRAFVNLPLGKGKRKRVYLGDYNSAESLAEYDKVVGNWLATKRAPDVDNNVTTVASVAERFRSEQKRKVSESKRYHLDAAIKILVELFPDRPALEFDSLQMNRLRSELIDRGYSRKYCNDILVIVKRCFKWSMQRDYITTDQHVKIQSIDSVSSGEAPTKIVEPANDDDVNATLPLLSRDFQDTIAFLRATGCRPGEARLMQVGDIDRENWLLHRDKHKTAHKGKSRYVPIPSSVREILLPRLLRPEDAFVFGADGGDRPYEKRALGRAIDRAIKKLNEQRSEDDLPTVDHWHPYRLRHLRATEVREQYGVEVAQVLLGHARISMTEHYAGITEAKAKEVGKLIG
jgi:integrase